MARPGERRWRPSGPPAVHSILRSEAEEASAAIESAGAGEIGRPPTRIASWGISL
ncbi:MAG: hypothetical protein OZSIB_0991 [Candidatus Ozemobacter sibiricus]|uniref:Uncharacterized protein n=1 Tax=Candidatus Ozemobacter sibiricus TaxID=2268124 RepID=A0A367ZNC8_9BACT|nr:MAG: hypothetical protein OZSIB_0991 [Candidatus Ozemobacter sibiricus]